MHRWTAAFLGIFAVLPLHAQERGHPISLDSGTVVRLRWLDGREKAVLLAPLDTDSAMVRYCRYPSPVCGKATINPPRARSIDQLAGVDVRRGSHTVRGALIGAAGGTVGLLVLMRLAAGGIGDGPQLSGGEQAGALALMAGVWGGIGALIGASSDKWQPVQ
jgi:hypothetical protein